MIIHISLGFSGTGISQTKPAKHRYVRPALLLEKELTCLDFRFSLNGLENDSIRIPEVHDQG